MKTVYGAYRSINFENLIVSFAEHTFFLHLLLQVLPSGAIFDVYAFPYPLSILWHGWAGPGHLFNLRLNLRAWNLHWAMDLWRGCGRCRVADN